MWCSLNFGDQFVIFRLSWWTFLLVSRGDVKKDRKLFLWHVNISSAALVIFTRQNKYHENQIKASSPVEIRKQKARKEGSGFW